MKQHDLEERVELLFHRAADAISPDLNLAPDIIRQAAVRPQRSVMRGVRTSTPGWIYPVVAAVLVVALIVSGFTWARPLIFQWMGNGSLEQATLEHATTVNRIVTVAGITLHVEQAYADAALTAVTFRITSAQASKLSFHVDGEALLVGADQTRYGAITSTGFNDEYLAEFEPMALDKLGSSQTLTLSLPSMQSGGSPAGPGPSITGPWEVTFQITPQLGRSITFNQAPVMHDGVAVQPLRLDLAPAGARLLIRISGLAPNTLRFPLKHFVTHQELGGIRRNADGSSIGFSSQGTSDGGPLELDGPNGQRLIPAWIVLPDDLPPDEQGMPLNRQVVGPSGVMVLSVLFFTPLSAQNGIVHVALDQVDVVTIDAQGHESERLRDGPWAFQLPLTAP